MRSLIHLLTSDRDQWAAERGLVTVRVSAFVWQYRRPVADQVRAEAARTLASDSAFALPDAELDRIAVVLGLVDLLESGAGVDPGRSDRDSGRSDHVSGRRDRRASGGASAEQGVA